MKKTNKQADVSAPQIVTDFIKLQTEGEAIQIGFTNQRVSAHAGIATWAGYLHWHGLLKLLESWLPPRCRRRDGLSAGGLALGFMTGLLAGAKKLAQVAWLRRDPLLPSLLHIERIASQSTYTRFFQNFDGAAGNLRSFRSFWRWGLERLSSRPGGYTLDLDTTKLLHEDGHQEGVFTAMTAEGFRRCLHPMLAVIAEAKVVAGFWLRSGNTDCENNVIGFTLELLSNLPRHVRVGLVRGDSGFCYGQWLDLLEDRHLAYIVVGRLQRPVQQLLKRETIWNPTEVPGTEVAEVMHQERGWRTARRLILLRHRIAEKERPCGKRLLDCPGYSYQALVTNLPLSVCPIELWRHYNGRAGTENVIKELAANFGLPQLGLKKFWSTEAALSLAVFAHNLCMLFQRHLGWLERVTTNTLRFRIFTTGGIISRTGGLTTLRLAVPQKEQPWWRCILEKLASPFPNCNSVPYSFTDCP